MKTNKDLGLSEKILDSISDVLSFHLSVHEAKVFGSRAKGNYPQGSDVDIALFGKDIVLDEILKIRIELEKLGSPYTFDVVRIDETTDKKLLEHIQRVGVCIYKHKVK